jgi:hypothetical protein
MRQPARGGSLARIYGTRTTLPDGRDSRQYLAPLAELEAEAKKQRQSSSGNPYSPIICA